MTATASSQNNHLEDAFGSLLSSLGEIGTSSAASSDAAATIIRSLEEKLDGPSGIIHFLLPRLWLSSPDEEQTNTVVRGDNALSILSYLVASRPAQYMSLTSSIVRRHVERHFTSVAVGSGDEGSKAVSDALIVALAKLLVGPSSDNQTGIATDASASLLALCRYDMGQNYCGEIAKRVLTTINMIWFHLQQEGKKKQRELSSSKMRIAALMVDISLLGGKEMSLALSVNDTTDQGIMDKLLHIALDHPNNDPLLQMSALDQLERLAVHNDVQCPVTVARADFLLGSDILRRGLLCLVGSPGDLSNDASDNDEWGELDPINGGAALRLLTEICRLGVASFTSVSEETRDKLQLLLSSFQRALHNFLPRGELERLSYIHAVSSLVASCATMASLPTNGVAYAILNDTTLLHEWLSLHSRVPQPQLKATVLFSLSQAMEPAMWKDDSLGSKDAVVRPDDSIAILLYQAFSHANNERDSAELILASAKSPFVEERLGAYSILRALVMRGVGARLLLLYDDGTGNGSDSSFLEWLLNQALESTSEGKKAKYEIVDSMLSQNGNILGGLLPAKALQQLEDWRRAGPNFMKTIAWELATE